MIKQKRKFNQPEENDNDDEQIVKTLNFFDAIIDQYLIEQDNNNENHILNNSVSNHVNTSPSSSSSSSSHYISVPQFRHHSEQTSHVRRYTSENSLNQITNTTTTPTSSSSKPKLSHTRPLRTTATSTEDLTSIPTQTRLSNFIKKSNQQSLNSISASLIDLSSIDKLSSRPRFRFVPPSNSNNNILKEEPEIEQQQQQQQQQFHLKTIPNNQTSFVQSTKPSHKIVKPIVIIPSIPKSAPINRLIETNIHHQNGNSAFKPHRSSKNGVSSKIQQIKRTESIQKSNLHVGITNSNNSLPQQQQQQQQQQSIPQFHQSMLNLSSPEPIRTNRFISRSSNQSNKANGYHPPSRPTTYEDPVVRWVQQVNNTSSINGLVYHPANRSQQQNYPYGSHISTNNGISTSMNNHRQQNYYNPPKHSAPVQSIYYASSPVTRNGVFPSSSSNVYNFNQNHSPRNEQQSKRHQNRQNTTITTYL